MWQVKKVRKQILWRVNSDEKTEQTSEERKVKKITWYLLVASPFCLVTFLTVMAACRFWYSEISKPKQASENHLSHILNVMRHEEIRIKTYKHTVALYHPPHSVRILNGRLGKSHRSVVRLKSGCLKDTVIHKESWLLQGLPQWEEHI